MSSNAELPEVWLRGPVPGIPEPLQPVAHAILQAREEVDRLLDGFPEELLWARPAGVAPPGFHLQHLSGVLDRLFTYARGEALSPEQRSALLAEGEPTQNDRGTAELLERFHTQVERALDQLSRTAPDTLGEPRHVGRARLPSTVHGLLSHAAEHTQRHVGQLLVTTRVLRAGLR